MIRTRRPAPLTLMTVAALLVLADCGNDDERLLELSRESLRRQAEQNEQMARQSQEITEASRDLVAADAKARREMIGVHQDLQTERQSLDRQHEDLESERRQIAGQRHRDPIIADALLTIGLILAALLPLVVAWMLLRQLFSQSDDAVLADVLVTEITSANPVLLTSPTERQRLPEGRTEPNRRIGIEMDRPPPVLVIVEGRHDIAFLRRISRILHADDDRIPDLDRWEQAQRILFVPAGGDNIADWTTRLAVLSQREFHLYDREGDAHAKDRQKLVDAVNSRPGCRAFLTRMRSLENYLHAEAIFEAQDIRVSFGDSDCVATVVAQTLLNQKTPGAWEQVGARGRRRLRNAAKRWLNTDAVEHMTAERLAERDPANEVRLWLTAIGELADASPADRQA